MSIFQNIIHPPDVKYYGFSQPMIGSVIPGIRKDYHVITRNHADVKEGDLRHTKKVNPVVQFPSMHEPHGKGHPMIEKLKQMLSKNSDPQKGYSRMSEDLSWRGQAHLANRAHS
jgi:hypothetical protein